MSVRRLPSGRWQATISLGTCSTKEEAEARCSTTLPGSCSTPPAPELACRTPAGTTERQADTLEALLKRHLSPDTMARLSRIQTELQVDSLEPALDYLVSDACWTYT